MSDELVESSMNFDQENVRPFLQRIVPFITYGFGEWQIDEVMNLIESMAHDEERELSFDVVHDGQSTPLIVHVFMDDIGAPDVYFFTSARLAELIDSEMEQFCEDLDI